MNNSKDSLDLTKPPPDISNISDSGNDWKIEEDHTPEDADCGDKRRNYWKYCFVAYRYQIFKSINGDSKSEHEFCKEVMKMLCARSTGDMAVKLHRIRYNSKTDCWRYVKFSQCFVDNWPELAQKGLTKIYMNKRCLDKVSAEKLALSLLP